MGLGRGARKELWNVGLLRMVAALVILISLDIRPLAAQAADPLPCEVMEVTPQRDEGPAALRNIRFLLIHHANAADRQGFSKWLRENSGKEVLFTSRGETRKALLYRLAHCFGRGLLVFEGPARVNPRDIIDVVLESGEGQRP